MDICKMIRAGIKDEAHAKPFYEKLRDKIDTSNEEDREEIEKILEEEMEHHQTLERMSKKYGCKSYRR
jgi:rubrerythrin